MIFPLKFGGCTKIVLYNLHLWFVISFICCFQLVFLFSDLEIIVNVSYEFQNCSPYHSEFQLAILDCPKVNWWKTKEFRKTFMQSQHTLHGKKIDKGRFLSHATCRQPDGHA